MAINNFALSPTAVNLRQSAPRIAGDEYFLAPPGYPIFTCCGDSSLGGHAYLLGVTLVGLDAWIGVIQNTSCVAVSIRDATYPCCAESFPASNTGGGTQASCSRFDTVSAWFSVTRELFFACFLNGFHPAFLIVSFFLSFFVDCSKRL